MNGVLHSTAVLIGDVIAIGGVIGALAAFYRKIKLIALGQQCQLRSDITSVYYRHVEEAIPTLHEYERKNLDDLFEAYKALGGNHFVDDIYQKMRGWKVST